jgi:hypothetical protein
LESPDNDHHQEYDAVVAAATPRFANRRASPRPVAQQTVVLAKFIIVVVVDVSPESVVLLSCCSRQ